MEVSFKFCSEILFDHLLYLIYKFGFKSDVIDSVLICCLLKYPFFCNSDVIKIDSSTTRIYFRSHELHNSVIFVFETEIISEGQPYEVLSI